MTHIVHKVYNKSTLTTPIIKIAKRCIIVADKLKLIYVTSLIDTALSLVLAKILLILNKSLTVAFFMPLQSNDINQMIYLVLSDQIPNLADQLMIVVDLFQY